MHGRRRTLSRQRQPVIELLEFGNIFTVTYGLAHGGTIALCAILAPGDAVNRRRRNKKGPARGYANRAFQKLWRYGDTDAPQPLMTIYRYTCRHCQSDMIFLVKPASSWPGFG